MLAETCPRRCHTASTWRALLGPAISLLLLASSSTTHAGNDDEILMGNDAALLGGAVTAVTASASALWYNPAGLARADFDAFDVSAQALTMRW